MFLTYTELVELTQKKRASSQAKVLSSMGILYRPRSDGSLAVSKTHVEQTLGVVALSGAQKTREPELRLCHAQGK
jgi:hypothetical protein